MTLAPPAAVPLHLVASIEATALNQAFGQAERHRCIVGPLARLEVEWPASDHIYDGLESAFGPKLHRRAHRVSNCESSEAADHLLL